MTYLNNLECSYCHENYDPGQLMNLCPQCGKPLLARYRLDRLAREISRDRFAGRGFGLWRYRHLLPVIKEKNKLTLGEGGTPILRACNLGRAANYDALYVKDESANPTGSFKARGMAVAVSKAMELGASSISIPSAGNAAGAMSAYAAAARMKADVFMPRDVPHSFIRECSAFGAEVNLVEGLITDAGRMAARHLAKSGGFDLSTLKEPYRLEGKKTMGFEIAEQMGWELPDVIIYPTGGGTGLIGIWKAFLELRELGWLDGSLPKMVAVQSDGCAPIVRAFNRGSSFADNWEGAYTIADGIRVPSAVGDFIILEILEESGGTALEVSDSQLMNAAGRIAAMEGLFVSPEAAATLLAFEKLLDDGWIERDQTVLLMITGSGMKYLHLWRD
ncbi:MAG: threonine synthase [Candidatus Latescibacteria bacterium]|nr:threonine synthase [bacterium]MBD3425296.1 threonine synthase [Candidatus Latescibacterota bacterium]